MTEALNTVFCIKCKKTHYACYRCMKNNRINSSSSDNKILYCCNICDKLNPKETWEDKQFLKDNNIVYPNNKKKVIKVLFSIVNRNQTHKTSLIHLPIELWLNIFKFLNNNHLGKQKHIHSFPHCKKCLTTHKFDESFILNINDNYTIEEKHKILAYYFLKKNYTLIYDNVLKVSSLYGYDFNHRYFSKKYLIKYLKYYIDINNIDKTDSLNTVYESLEL